MRKRHIFILISTLLVLLVLCLLGKTSYHVYAEGEGLYEEYNGFYYREEYGEIAILDYHGDSDDIMVPSKIDGKNVTKIYSHSFSNNTHLKKVTILSPITNLETELFSNCINLTKVNLPESLTSIGDSVFEDCHSLTEITIPDSVTDLGNYSFNCCTNLKKVYLPTNLNNMGHGTFSWCENLEELTIPQNVTRIESDTFSNCSSLKKIIIPNSVTHIDSFSFAGCSNITEILIPSSVEYIGPGVFLGCTKMESLKVDNTNEYYDDGNGSNVIIEKSSNKLIQGINNSIIPSYVICIGESAFEGCTNLKSIDVPNSVICIESRAFGSCSSLEQLTIPETVSSIGDAAFYNCIHLKTIVIPKNTELSGYHTFSGCSCLSEISLPDNTLNIGEDMFRGCSSLKSITIPEGVSSIDEFAFNSCTNLRSVTIPTGVTYIGKSAFGSCEKLDNIIIPDGIISIANYTFWGCESLHNISFPEGLINIGEGALGYCPDLKEIILPQSLELIDDYAFCHCYNLKEINIPNNVSRIGDYAFQHCSSIIELEIPNSVTSIGDYTFDGCWDMEEIVIPSSVISIGDNAFNDIRALSIYTVEGSYAETYAIEHNIPVLYGRRIKFNKSSYYAEIGKTIKINFTLYSDSYEDLQVEVENLDYKVIGKLQVVDFHLDNLPDISLNKHTVSGYIKVKGEEIDNVQLVLYFKDLDNKKWSRIINVDYDTPEAKRTYSISNHTLTIKNESSLLPGDVDVELTIPWGFEMLERQSDIYYNDLAIPSLILSRTAETGKTNIENMLTNDFGFKNPESKYDSSGIGSPCYSFANKEYIYHGNKKVVIAIVCRGTVDSGDVWNDLMSPFGSFEASANSLMELLKDYIKKYQIDSKYQPDDIKFFITGHSLGAAVANLVAVQVEQYTTTDNIYAYTFASPCTTYNGAFRGNIFNILNVEDQVAHVPVRMTNYPRYGVEIWFDRSNTQGIYNNFSELTGGLSGDKTLKCVMESWNFFQSTPVIGAKFKYAHANKTYLSYLLCDTNGDTNKYKIKRAKVACPVDVEIYSPTGEILGKITDNKIDESIQQGVLMYVDGDDKYVYMLYEGEYTFKLSGTDSGTMTYSIQEVNVETGEVEEEKVFKNISLEKGKEMVSTVTNDSEDSSSDIQDVEIYVTDEEGNKVSEIGEDGKETALITSSPTATAAPSSTKTPTPTTKPTDIPSSVPVQSPSPKNSEQPVTSPTVVPTQVPGAQVKAPKKPTIKSVKNSKGKKLTVKWKKVKGAKGYQVQYALDKGFKKSLKSKTLTKTLFTKKGLKKKKTYYVRVRAYVKDSKGNKVFGGWSKVKKVKIKK